MPTPPSSKHPAARLWAVAGSVAAGVGKPKKEEAVVEGLELFAAASAKSDDGYARWKAEVAAERAAQEAAQRAAELPTRADESGFAAWKAEAEAARRAFEQRWGIPLGKLVRVQLRGEPREREGLLFAVEEAALKRSTKLHLRLGSHVFPASQIESVVRM